MAKTAKEIKSFQTVMSNLNKEIKQIEGLTTQGLLFAAIHIRRDMDKTPPLIPVDKGFLRASWFITPIHHKTKPRVIMGFTARYAVHVHEMVGSNVQWKRPNSGPKFFESAIKRNHKKILDILKRHARIR